VADGYVPIGKLFNVEKGQLQSTKCTPGVFDFITAAEDWKTHHDYDHECEALIFAAAASGSLGRTHYVDGKFISSDLCFILTPKDEEKYPLNLEFYHFVFNSLRPTLVAATKSGTSKESINQTNFKKYELPYFSIEQQDSWIEKLKSTMVRKDLLGCELTHQQTLLKKLRQQILQEAIEGKLTADWREENPDVEPASELLARIKAEKEQLIKDKKIKKQKALPPITDKEKPFDLPDGWGLCRLDGVVTFTNGKAHEQLIDSSGEYILINSKYISMNGRVIKRTSKCMCPVYKNDILIVMSDVPNGKALARCFLVDKNDAYSLNQRIGSLTPLGDLFPEFLALLLDRNKHFLGFNDGKKQTNLRKDQILSCPLAIPTVSEQKAIVSIVEKLFAVCDQLETQVTSNQAHAEQLMQAVLKEAFSQSSNTCAA